MPPVARDASEYRESVLRLEPLESARRPSTLQGSGRTVRDLDDARNRALPVRDERAYRSPAALQHPTRELSQLRGLVGPASGYGGKRLPVRRNPAHRFTY